METFEGGWASPQPPYRKRARLPPDQCQVPGCEGALQLAYHKKYHVCAVHFKAPCLAIDGILQRFCQKCGRFQPLGEFDDEKRTCREALETHNARRRKRDTSQVGASQGHSPVPSRAGLRRAAAAGVAAAAAAAAANAAPDGSPVPGSGSGGGGDGRGSGASLGPAERSTEGLDSDLLIALSAAVAAAGHGAAGQAARVVHSAPQSLALSLSLDPPPGAHALGRTALSMPVPASGPQLLPAAQLQQPPPAGGHASAQVQAPVRPIRPKAAVGVPRIAAERGLQRFQTPPQFSSAAGPSGEATISLHELLGSSAAEGSSSTAAGAHAQLSRQLTAILSQLASQPQQAQQAQQVQRPAQGQHLHPHQMAGQLAQQHAQQQLLHWQQRHHLLHTHAMSLDVPPSARQQAPLQPPAAQQRWEVPAALLQPALLQQQQAQQQQAQQQQQQGQQGRSQPLAEWWATGVQHATQSQAQAQWPPVKLEQQQEQQGQRTEAVGPSIAAANAAQQQHWPSGSPGKPLVCTDELGSLAQPGSTAAAAAGQSDMDAEQPGFQLPAMPSTNPAAQSSQPAPSPAPAAPAPACASPLPALAEQGLRTLSSASGAQLLESVMKQLHQLTGARPGVQQAQQAPGPLPACPSTQALLAALASAQSRANGGASAGNRE